MADTGLLISHAFDEKGLATNEVYKRILFNKLEVNLGMIVENIVEQMLVASGHQLYFFSNSSREDASSRMEIDFLIANSKITNSHNISPLEVKSGKNYTLSSIRKFLANYSKYSSTPYILHMDDLKDDGKLLYLPLYMTELL